MENRARERIGLIIFFALVIVGGIVLTSYFATGLTWTVYATSIDDRVGNMEGYAVIVYPGTVPEEDAAADAEPAEEEAAGEGDIPAIADTIGLRILEHYPGIDREGYDGVFTSDVRELYEKKGARAATINAQGIIAHPDPKIIYIDGRRIGVFGADAYMGRLALGKVTSALREEGAEVIVCVTKRMAFLADTAGIDVVLLTDDSGRYPTTGTREGDTLIVQAPRTGEAGVLLFSNNNVASARSIDAL